MAVEGITEQINDINRKLIDVFMVISEFRAIFPHLLLQKRLGRKIVNQRFVNLRKAVLPGRETKFLDRCQ